MDTLIDINNALNNAIEIRAVQVTDENIWITSHIFRRNSTLVNTNGEFIGQRYGKFLWWKYETQDYYLYKIIFKDGYQYEIGYYKDNRFYDIYNIKNTLNNLIKTGIFIEETKRLLELVPLAEDNLAKQNKILDDLKKKLV